jgi:hypothetical protein
MMPLSLPPEMGAYEEAHMIRFLTQTSSRSHRWGRLLAFAATLSAAGCHSGSMAMDNLPPPDRPAHGPRPLCKGQGPKLRVDAALDGKRGSGYTAYLIEYEVAHLAVCGKEVDRPQWQHDLTIIKPDNLTPGPAVLAISGGDNSRRAPDHGG